MASLKSREKRYQRERAQFLEVPKQEDFINIHVPEIIPLPERKLIVDLMEYPLYVDGKLLVSPITFQMKGREKIGIIGKNGIGKTTLLKVIADKMYEHQNDIMYMPQWYSDMLEDDLSSIDYIMKDSRLENVSEAMTLLGSLRFLPYEMHGKIRYLSGGQKAKLLLLKLYVCRQNILVLDEPTRNLSPTSAHRLIDILKNYSGAILSVSHDRHFLTEICDTIYELTEDGLHSL